MQWTEKWLWLNIAGYSEIFSRFLIPPSLPDVEARRFTFLPVINRKARSLCKKVNLTNWHGKKFSIIESTLMTERNVMEKFILHQIIFDNEFSFVANIQLPVVINYNPEDVTYNSVHNLP